MQSLLPERQNSADPDHYDQIEYPSRPLAQAHPDRLATVASLFGLKSPSLHGFRLLEVGCGTGKNLLSLALSYPGAMFTGIDRSVAQIETAKNDADSLGVDNLQFLALDLTEFVATDQGLFDFVVAHGVYSWVPHEVRQALLKLCQQTLAPAGIAYISYNANPGWRIKGVAREFLRYQAGHIKDPVERLKSAQAWSQYVVNAGLADGGLSALSDLAPQPDELPDSIGNQRAPGYLFHEYLEQSNEAFYVTEFVDAARKYGLKFVAEANIHEMAPNGMSQSVAEVLASMGDDIIAQEQHLDFLKGRMFRQTLLCHADQPADTSIDPKRLFGLTVACEFRCDTDLASHVWGQPMVISQAGASISVVEPVAQAALLALSNHWPAAMAFRELIDLARQHLDEAQFPIRPVDELDDDCSELATELLRLALAGFVELSIEGPKLTNVVRPYPKASQWARWCLGEGKMTVTNMRDQPVALGGFQSRLLLLLDGTRDLNALVENLLPEVGNNEVTVMENGVELSRPLALRKVLTESLKLNLAQAAKQALLVE